MENTKQSKKALKKLINASMRDAINSLELPKANKKVKRLIDRNSKKLASEFRALLRKAKKAARKGEESVAFMEGMINGKSKKRDKKESSSLEPAQA